MNKIKTIRFSYLRADAHARYLVTFKSLLLKYPTIQSIVMLQYIDFEKLLILEEEILNNMRKSVLTEKITATGILIDGYITSIGELINANIRSSDPDIAEAAKILQVRFKAFGNIARKAYEEETESVNLLLNDLEFPPYLDYIEILGLSTWIADLRSAEIIFEQLLDERNDEYAAKPKEHLRNIRHQIEIIYHNMIDRLTASAIIGSTDPTIFIFIDKLNAEITYFNDHNHHAAKKDISIGDDTVMEPIPTQVYNSGQAITPLPVVYYQENEKPTLKLEFAKDYSVTYKNNKEVGMANLIIHGKGAYKGLKTTTFNIARI